MFCNWQVLLLGVVYEPTSSDLLNLINLQVLILSSFQFFKVSAQTTTTKTNTFYTRYGHWHLFSVGFQPCQVKGSLRSWYQTSLLPSALCGTRMPIARNQTTNVLWKLPFAANIWKPTLSINQSLLNGRIIVTPLIKLVVKSFSIAYSYSGKPSCEWERNTCSD